MGLLTGALLTAVMLVLPQPVMLGLPAFMDTTNVFVQREIVNKHNYLRSSVKPSATNMRKMVWSKEAAANAVKWTKKCVFAHSNFNDRIISTSGCGENIYSSSHPSNWSTAIMSWYNEVRIFTYNKLEGPWYTVGHYTQVVWATTYQIGCAAGRCEKGYYLVCQYCPPGNYAGQIERPYEAGKKCARCRDHCDEGLCTTI
ncbi:cysteine-rich secretory protein 3-like [Ambystoma mexicanum]|uniref:cysteine-rich secretory protein 3-like n=1 Tax=Ambystoma mexicanum TaxID=8296 RepID=UPI0037E83613